MTNKTYTPLLIQSVKAAADLEQHRFVGFDGNYCAAGAKAYGVSDVSTAKGQLAPVALFGNLLVIAGGAITAGDAVASDSDGKAIKAEGNAIVNGYALDSGIAGDEIRIVRGI